MINSHGWRAAVVVSRFCSDLVSMMGAFCFMGVAFTNLFRRNSNAKGDFKKFCCDTYASINSYTHPSMQYPKESNN